MFQIWSTLSGYEELAEGFIQSEMELRNLLNEY